MRVLRGASSGDSSVEELRPQLRSARNVIQTDDAGDKRLLRLKSRKVGEDTKVSTKIDGGISERVNGGIDGRVNGGIGERVDGGIGERVDGGSMSGSMVGLVRGSMEETVRGSMEGLVRGLAGGLMGVSIKELIGWLVTKRSDVSVPAESKRGKWCAVMCVRNGPTLGVYWHEGRCGGDRGKRDCVPLLSVNMSVGTAKKGEGVKKARSCTSPKVR